MSDPYRGPNEPAVSEDWRRLFCAAIAGYAARPGLRDTAQRAEYAAALADAGEKIIRDREGK